MSAKIKRESEPIANETVDDGLAIYRSLHSLEGKYRIRLLGRTREHFPSTITFARDGDALWGRFQLAEWRGIMLIEPEGFPILNRDHEYEWYAQDVFDTDEVYSGRGYIKFASNGVMDGLLDAPVILEFDGQHLVEPALD